MKPLLSCLLLFLGTLCFGQTETDFYEDEKYTFYSIIGGIQQNTFSSDDVIFEKMDGELGYNLGLSLTHLPDIESSNLLLRTSVFYSNESSQKEAFEFQNELVTTNVLFNSVGLDFFLACRFSLNPKTIPYIGGGLGYQFTLVNSTERFTIDRNGETLSIFENSDPSLPVRFGNDAPSGMILTYLESGVFFRLGNKFMGVNGRLGYGFISGGRGQGLKIGRLNVALNASYQIF